MTSLLAFACAINLTQYPLPTYSFPVGEAKKFHVTVELDGYIPLFGGKVGKANVTMDVQALGVLVSNSMYQAVESSVVEIKAVAFKTTLPLTPKNIDGYFPKGTAVFGLTGLVKSNTVESKPMPVQLPGLDSQSLPEISYLPLVFDQEALKGLKPYEFTRTFNGVPMKYTVTPSSMVENMQKFAIEVAQESSGFEDAYGNTSTEDTAKSKLSTKLTGTGKATFNQKVGLFDKVVVETNAETTVTNIKTGNSSTRNLKTTLTIVRDGAKVDE